MKNILVLVPHWNSPICNYLIRILQQKHHVVVLLFNEKEVKRPEGLVIEYEYLSTVHVSYSEDRLFTYTEEKEVFDQIQSIIDTHAIEYVFSAKHRYEHLLATFKEKIKARTFVPRLETIDLFQDKLKTYHAFNEDVRVPIVFDSIPENDEYYSKSAKEYIKNRDGTHISDLMHIEKLYYPEINATVLIRDSKIHKLFVYQVTTHEGVQPSREHVTDQGVIQKIEQMILSMSYRLATSESCVHNIDFMYSKTGELVLSEINAGRLPAGLGDLPEAQEIVDSLVEEWPVLV